MATSEDLLVELLVTSREQLRWTRAATLPGIRTTVADALLTTQQRRAFELCDGTRQSNDIASAVGTSKQNFSGWTRRWRNLGIAYEVEARRIRHLASLETLGLSVEVDEDSVRGRQGS